MNYYLLNTKDIDTTKIQVFLVKEKLSKNEFAEKLGITRQALYKKLSGEKYHHFTEDQVGIMRYLFNCKLEDLITDEAIEEAKRESEEMDEANMRMGF